MLKLSTENLGAGTQPKKAVSEAHGVTLYWLREKKLALFFQTLLSLLFSSPFHQCQPNSPSAELWALKKGRFQLLCLGVYCYAAKTYWYVIKFRNISKLEVTSTSEFSSLSHKRKEIAEDEPCMKKKGFKRRNTYIVRWLLLLARSGYNSFFH